MYVRILTASRIIIIMLTPWAVHLFRSPFKVKPPFTQVNFEIKHDYRILAPKSSSCVLTLRFFFHLFFFLGRNIELHRNRRFIDRCSCRILPCRMCVLVPLRSCHSTWCMIRRVSSCLWLLMLSFNRWNNTLYVQEILNVNGLFLFS